MDNFIITIARGFGSGGKTIGEELAKKLGVKCYNKELLELASERSGINKEYFFEKDEKVSKKLGKRNTGAYQGVTSSFSDSMFFTEHNLFEYQAKTIVNLANTESCVIIGRAADFILKNFDNVVSVDIQAPKDVCVIEIMDRYKISWQEALNSVETTNSNRAEFYRYYTGRLWNDPCNYDLTLNSARVGRDKCADVIIDYAERKLGRSIRPEKK
ncbi:MAG: cytidylate kinase-like family protein [Lachnospiraceae bacterium]|nr:cytidylate kinase-like family protein [Lachnospiraceae bacterium]